MYLASLFIGDTHAPSFALLLLRPLPVNPQHTSSLCACQCVSSVHSFSPHSFGHITRRRHCNYRPSQTIPPRICRRVGVTMHARVTVRFLLSVSLRRHFDPSRDEFANLGVVPTAAACTAPVAHSRLHGGSTVAWRGAFRRVATHRRGRDKPCATYPHANAAPWNGAKQREATSVIHASSPAPPLRLLCDCLLSACGAHLQ